jgi:integrase
MELPCEFEIKKLIEEFHKLKKYNMKISNVRCALKLIKKELNIDILNNEILGKIDEWMKIYYLNKEIKTPRLDQLHSMARTILVSLFNYNFRCIPRTYVIKNNIRKNILDLYENDDNIKYLIDKFNKYLESTNLAVNTKRMYSNHLVLTFVPLKEYFINNNITRDIILNRLQEIENNSKEIITTKIQDYVRQISATTEDCIKTFNRLIKSEIILSIKDIKLFKPQEIISKERIVIKVEKDYFSEEELEELNKVTTDEREKLILTIFLSTGMRIGGLENIKVGGMFDENFNVLKVGQTIEKKNNKLRKFVIFHPLKQALENYKKSEIYGNSINNLEYSLFPPKIGTSKKIMDNKKSFCRGTLIKIIKDIFLRADITGHNAHSHAFRKTIVIKLMSEGNSLENVSKFIGHSSATVTAKHYWVPTQQDLLKNMNMQWLLGENNLKKVDNITLASISSKTLQLEKITSALMEGFMAKERLTHVITLMTPEQIELIDKLWTNESNMNVSRHVRNVMVDIIENITTISDLSSVISSNL